METRIGLLKQLPAQIVGEEIYFKLDDFILLLKTNTSDSDGIKVKPTNVIREISSYLDKIIVIDGKKYITNLACFKFVFNNTYTL